MEHTETPTGKPHSNPRMAAYRQRMKDRGLKQVQFWAVDPTVSDFQRKLKQQVKELDAAAENRILEEMLALTDCDSWI